MPRVKLDRSAKAANKVNDVAVKLTRPSRILNTRKKQTAKQARESDQSNSPLMCLPPELRNRIYTYVFGGKTIHVLAPYRFGDSKNATISICQAEISDHDAAHSIRSSEGETDVQQYDNRHDRCHLHNTVRAIVAGKLHLQILQTCRQIHQEAALLPFQSNVFAFSCVARINPFMKLLVPVQRRAIMSLTLSGTAAEWCMSAVKELKGLKRVLAFREVARYEKASLSLSHDSTPDQIYLAKRRAMLGIEILQALALESCTFCIYGKNEGLAIWDSTQDVSPRTKLEPFNSLASAMESSIMGTEEKNAHKDDAVEDLDEQTS